MKKYSFIVSFCLLFIILGMNSSQAGVYKWVKVGNFQTKIVDSGDQGESSGEGTFHYYYYDKFEQAGTDHSGWMLGTRDWTDENGAVHTVKISGAGHGTADETRNTIPIPDENGNTINRYVRYKLPEVEVDGLVISEPFPQTADAVDPTKIPGTADIMIESTVNTSMGLTIHQKVLAWSQKNHDDYIIWDWTFTNTGNVDLDPESELPNQTLHDVYFTRANNFYAGSNSGVWHSAYGESEGDSLRISYAYPAAYPDAERDDFGGPDFDSGFLGMPWYIGDAMLHIDKSTSDESDDLAQPHWTAANTAELLYIKNEANINTLQQHTQLYDVMQNGFSEMPFMTGTYPGTHHNSRMDDMGIEDDVSYPEDFGWWNWRACSYTGTGPFTVAPGESFRIVWATVYGSISPEKGWEVGRAWLDEEATWDGENNLPEVHEYFGLYDTDSDYAKDCWVATGKDSLFANAWAAQWAVENDYNVPIPPPAPSITVQSLPDGVKLSWYYDSTVDDSDVAGYRVYRAVGSTDTTFFPIYECGDGTANPLANTYTDDSAQRGEPYFYYVAAFDQAADNAPGVNGVSESLESGKYLNRTTAAAYLTRPAGTSLSQIRVVPNPFSVSARHKQFTGDDKNKIMFYDVPGVCTIRIYTESGDLVKTIEHTDQSGDEAFGNVPLDFTTTETGQIVVSGLYIANISTPSGESINVKFIVIQ
ncbi:hypothetical protein HQ585_00520 [candidate division KSB1 bacterium]|nr:hypothetical protein [candidate division KSB1 bacterium]